MCASPCIPAVILYKSHIVPNYIADCDWVPRWTLLDLTNKLDLTEELLEWNFVCMLGTYCISFHHLARVSIENPNQILQLLLGDTRPFAWSIWKHQPCLSELPAPRLFSYLICRPVGHQGKGEVLKQVRPSVLLWPSTPGCIPQGALPVVSVWKASAHSSVVCVGSVQTQLYEFPSCTELFLWHSIFLYLCIIHTHIFNLWTSSH